MLHDHVAVGESVCGAAAKRVDGDGGDEASRRKISGTGDQRRRVGSYAVGGDGDDRRRDVYIERLRIAAGITGRIAGRGRDGYRSAQAARREAAAIGCGRAGIDRPGIAADGGLVHQVGGAAVVGIQAEGQHGAVWQPCGGAGDDRGGIGDAGVTGNIYRAQRVDDQFAAGDVVPGRGAAGSSGSDTVGAIENTGGRRQRPVVSGYGQVAVGRRISHAIDHDRQRVTGDIGPLAADGGRVVVGRLADDRRLVETGGRRAVAVGVGRGGGDLGVSVQAICRQAAGRRCRRADIEAPGAAQLHRGGIGKVVAGAGIVVRIDGDDDGCTCRQAGGAADHGRGVAGQVVDVDGHRRRGSRAGGVEWLGDGVADVVATGCRGSRHTAGDA